MCNFDTSNKSPVRRFFWFFVCLASCRSYLGFPNMKDLFCSFFLQNFLKILCTAEILNNFILDLNTKIIKKQICHSIMRYNFPLFSSFFYDQQQWHCQISNCNNDTLISCNDKKMEIIFFPVNPKLLAPRSVFGNSSTSSTLAFLIFQEWFVQYNRQFKT